MINFQPHLKGSLLKGSAALAVLVSACGLASQVLAAPFQLGTEQQNFIENPPPIQNNSYATQQYVPPMQGQAASYDNPQQNLQGGTGQQTIRGGANRSVALPPAFLGSWAVQGQRTGIEAQPAFQQGIGNLFAQNTQNTWNIAGSPQKGYQMSNDAGVSTALTIYKVMNNQAFIRYQHPIGKTMAQEAIVMELQNGAATFQGLERISIIKDGQQPPRAKVTYQLNGQRQR
jgi:hypothetical protein